MGYNKNNSKGMPKHGMSQDHKMAYDRSEISRLKKDIHYDDLKKKSMGPTAYGKIHKGPSKMDPMYNGKPGVQKEDFQQFAGPSKHGKTHDSPMSMGGSFMSKHSSNSYFHKQNLLDDMPIDDHAGGPLKQTEISVYDDRKNKQGQTQSEILNAAADKVNKAIEQHNKTQFTSQGRLDTSKKMIDELQNNYTTKVDSINTANSKMNKLINEMNKGNYPGSLQN